MLQLTPLDTEWLPNIRVVARVRAPGPQQARRVPRRAPRHKAAEQRTRRACTVLEGPGTLSAGLLARRRRKAGTARCPGWPGGPYRGKWSDSFAGVMWGLRWNRQQAPLIRFEARHP